MKKTILSLLAIAAITTQVNAQVWNMVVTKTDGTTLTIATNDITNVSFEEPKLEDQNVDQIIIKEIYNGGCPTDDGKTYQFDKCIILYNNCGQQAVVNNLCFGALDPANSYSPLTWYDEKGTLMYEDEGYLPAWHGIWWFPQTLVIEPYSEVVVNVCGAIDNTQTVSQSVNYANSDYYCMYDPESGYDNTNYYPTPAAEIPSSHYLKAKEIAMGNGWTLSVTSPALIIFQPQDMSAAEFADNGEIIYNPAFASQAFACFKVPTDWVVDGVEVYSTAYPEDNMKRLTSDIDMGYVYLTNYLGHTLYRNVDKEATEALPENDGKLVYNYALGVDDSTDPSGIDAEASMKNGAHIVFMDTNNSTADFHERQRCSLRD